MHTRLSVTETCAGFGTMTYHVSPICLLGGMLSWVLLSHFRRTERAEAKVVGAGTGNFEAHGEGKDTAHHQPKRSLAMLHFQQAIVLHDATVSAQQTGERVNTSQLHKPVLQTEKGVQNH